MLCPLNIQVFWFGCVIHLTQIGKIWPCHDFGSSQTKHSSSVWCLSQNPNTLYYTLIPNKYFIQIYLIYCTVPRQKVIILHLQWNEGRIVSFHTELWFLIINHLCVEGQEQDSLLSLFCYHSSTSFFHVVFPSIVPPFPILLSKNAQTI